MIRTAFKITEGNTSWPLCCLSDGTPGHRKRWMLKVLQIQKGNEQTHSRKSHQSLKGMCGSLAAGRVFWGNISMHLPVLILAVFYMPLFLVWFWDINWCSHATGLELQILEELLILTVLNLSSNFTSASYLVLHISTQYFALVLNGQK